MREENKHPTTKHVNSISLVRVKEEKDVENNKAVNESVLEPDKSDAEVLPEEINKVIKTEDEPVISIKESVKTPSSQNLGYYIKHKINEKLIEGLMEIQRFNDSLSTTRAGIAKDVLVDVAGYVYLVKFMILDIKEDEKRPFILGTPFFTTAKAVIKFDKGTITLRSGKSKMSFYRIHKPLCRIEKGITNDIKLIAPTMTVNKLVLEWEEKIKLHREKKMKLDRWRSKIFNNERPASIKEECETLIELRAENFSRKTKVNFSQCMETASGFAPDGIAPPNRLYLMRRSLEVPRKFPDDDS
uniref:MAK10-like protein n=1 Tax=Tanacetum cinerariifolium TaxID=118510 RepID=A0A699JC70_TANCI|nr:hypothetical protein [Tanacetum cinerariifolium]